MSSVGFEMQVQRHDRDTSEGNLVIRDRRELEVSVKIRENGSMMEDRLSRGHRGNGSGLDSDLGLVGASESHD